MSDLVAARDTTFDECEFKSMWLDFSNFEKDKYLTVTLRIDGKAKIINEFYIPGIDRSEGILLHGHSLTWVFEKHKSEIKRLEAENSYLKAQISELETKDSDLTVIQDLADACGKMKERIVHAACIAENKMVLLGRSHADCFYQAQNVGLKIRKASGAQGFFTNKGRFVNRADAAKIAKRANQLDLASDRKVTHLLSEDIWYQKDRFLYCSMRGYVEIVKHEKPIATSAADNERV